MLDAYTITTTDETFFFFAKAQTKRLPQCNKVRVKLCFERKGWGVGGGGGGLDLGGEMPVLDNMREDCF